MKELDIIKAVSAIKYTPAVTSQDPLDHLAARLFVATVVERVAKSLRADVLEELKSDHHSVVQDVRELATSARMKASHALHGSQFTITVQANAPASTVDAGAFRNHLIKAGVAIDTVDTCMRAATKLATPATSFIATEGVPND